MIQWFSKVFLVLVLTCVGGFARSEQGRDVVLLIESPPLADSEKSLSLQSVITPFLQNLTASDHLGIITYRQDGVKVLQSLAAVSIDEKNQLPARLENALSDFSQMPIPTVLERAIYELRTHGRNAVDKRLVIIGNGVIGLADPASSDSLQEWEWMRNDLVLEARRLGIRIYWLTYSESADYRKIQTVTRNTGGSYYRIFDAAAVDTAMDELFPHQSAGNAAVGKQADLLLPPVPSSRESKPGLLTILADYQTYIFFFSGSLMIGISFFIFFYRRQRTPVPGKRAKTSTVSDRVLLRDSSNFTGRSEYDITARTTYISRQPREITQNSCVIVIRDTSISRDHATITCRDNAYWINDSGGVNGTYVNNVRIHDCRVLKNGDQIRFANFEFEFVSPQIQPGGVALAGDERNRELEDKDVTVLRGGKR